MAILLVKQSDAPVPDSPGKWRAGEIVGVFDDGHSFGSAEVPSAGNFYHVNVTNRTAAQVEQYQEQWQHEPTVSVVASQPPNYRIRVESPKASVSGKGEILQAQITEMLDRLATMIGGTTSIHDRGRTGNLAWFEFNALGIDEDERDLARDFIRDAVSNLPIKRRRFVINASGMSQIAANGGTISGPAGQVANYITDGLTE